MSNSDPRDILFYPFHKRIIDFLYYLLLFFHLKVISQLTKWNKSLSAHTHNVKRVLKVDANHK